MPILASEREDILELIVLMFDAAPGPYLDDVVQIYEALNGDMAELANILGGTGIFQALHPNFQTAEEFATDFLSTVGLEDNDFAFDFVVGALNSGLTKAEIMYIGWNYLDNLPLDAPQELLDAKAIMDNKADVAEVYSVDLRGDATAIGELQDVLAGVDETQASVDAAIDRLEDELAEGPTLTTGVDTINISGSDGATNISGVVDGDDDGSSAGSTFSAGDRITGNGNTNLNLTVVETGDADFAFVDNVEAINIIAGAVGTISFVGAEWDTVGAIMLDDGVDGLEVEVNLLEEGVDLIIDTDIAGTLDVVYDDGMRAVLWNGGDGGASLVDGVVEINANEAASAGIWFSGNADVALGTVTAVGTDGAELYFSADLTGGADLTAGDVTMSIGDENAASDWVSVSLDVAGAGADIALGNVMLTAGDDAGAIVDLFADGNVTVGNVDLTAGDGGTAWMSVTASGDITLANVVQVAGSSAYATFNAYGEGGVTIGDISQTVGATASMSVSITTSGTGTEDIQVGDIAQLGLDSLSAYVQVDNNQDGGNITVGMITQTVGDSATVTASVSSDSTGDISVGGIAQVAGDSADVNAFVHGDSGGNVTVGDISQSVGDSASMSISADVSSDGVMTLGDLSQLGGDSASAFVSLTADDGDLNVGSISSVVGANGSVDVFVSSSGTGDIAVGDVTLGVGDWTITTTSAAQSISLDVWNFGGGDLTVGDVDVDVGLSGYATLSFSNDDTDADLGSLTVGNFEVVLADKADMDLYIFNTATVTTLTGTDLLDVGALTVGNIHIVAGTNSSVDISISQGLWGAVTSPTFAPIEGGVVGDVAIGHISFEGGVGADVSIDIDISNTAAGEGDVGNVTLGGFDLEVDDGGSIDVSVDVYASGDVGDVAFGDVAAAVGVSGSIDEISLTVSGANVGAVSVGDVNIVVGQFGTGGTFTLNVSAFSGDVESVTVGDISVDIGQSATYSEINIEVDATGDIGSVVIGDFDLTLGVNASADSQAYDIEITASGNIGSVVIGNVTEVLATGAYVTDPLMVDISGADIGAVTFGDVLYTVGQSASITSESYVDIDAAGDIGTVIFGDISISLTGAGASWTASGQRSISATGTIDSVSFGTVSLVAMTDTMFTEELDFGVYGDQGVGDVSFEGFSMVGTEMSDSMTISVDVSASLGDVGSVDLGAITMSVVGTAATYDAWLDVEVSASDDMGDFTVGDVDLMADGAAVEVSVSIDLNAFDITGDINLGDISLSAAGAGANAQFNLDLTSFFTYDSVVNVGEITLAPTTGADVTLTIDGQDADMTIAGITIVDTQDGAGEDLTFGDDMWFAVTGDDVVVENIAFDVISQVTGAYDVTDVTSAISYGTITLGTVDFSGYELTDTAATTGENIDLSGFAGELVIIGTGRDDTIEGNDTSDNTFTGGEGADTFVVDGTDMDADTSAEVTEMTTITDFEAGPTSNEVLDVNPDNTSVAYYAEKTATSFANFITVAIAAMTDATQEADIVAVQVGADVYVAIDEDGGDNIDTVVVLTGVSTADLNFADFT